jgi:Bacterial Ig-like domain
MWSMCPLASLMLVTASFSMDATPSMIETSPETDGIQVPFDANLSITFSEPVNASGNWFQIVCTSSGTRNVADTSVSGGPTVFAIDPNVDFSEDEECTVTIFAAFVTDRDTDDPPDHMSADAGFRFRTEAPPGVAETFPVKIAPPSTNVVVRFNEPVSATTSSFTIVCGGGTVPYTWSTEDNMTYTLDPNSDLTDGQSCTVTVVAAQITDEDGIDPPETMTSDVVFSFSVDANASDVRNGEGRFLRVAAAIYADQGHERGHHAASDRPR